MLLSALPRVAVWPPALPRREAGLLGLVLVDDELSGDRLQLDVGRDRLGALGDRQRHGGLFAHEAAGGAGDERAAADGRGGERDDGRADEGGAAGGAVGNVGDAGHMGKVGAGHEATGCAAAGGPVGGEATHR